MSAVLRLRDAGKVVIFISHRSPVLQIADRIMLISAGQMVAFGERENILAKLRQQASI
jgi:ABC-type protease/lipase transport system fused ATPase/permease subunit